MTVQGNEQVQPVPVDQSVATQAAATPPVVEIDDPDLIELREAQAAAQAEEAAKTATPEPAQANGAPPTATPTEPQPQGQTPPTKAGMQMIPKPRFDEVNVRATKAEQEAAYWRGVAEGRTPATAANPGTPTAAPTQTPEQRLASVDQRMEALAKKFDEGEMGMVQFRAEERKLIKEADTIREEGRAKTVSAPEPQRGGDELYLETLTAKLEDDHPWVIVANEAGSDADWNYVKQRAIENLVERGVDPRQGRLGQYELRKEIAGLWTELGPGLLTARAAAKGIAIPGQTTTTTPQPNALSPQAQARKDKIALAATAPPDLTAMTNSGVSNNGVPTAAQLDTMSDEDIAALPPAVRNKFLGMTA